MIYFIFNSIYKTFINMNKEIYLKFWNQEQRHPVALNFHWWSQAGSCSASFKSAN